MRESPISSSSSLVQSQVLPGIWLDSRRAVWFAAERLLAIADLHWGYVASHRARGNLLPVWGDDEIERNLDALQRDYQPAEVLWLGDVVHAAEGAARAEAFIRNASVPIMLVAGNHDRRWRAAGVPSMRRGNYFFHHGDRALTVPDNCIEVVGHHHPAASWWDGAGTHLKLPALVVGPQRLVLPAFSPWAAGTPWSPQSMAGETLWAISPSRILQLTPPTRIAS